MMRIVHDALRRDLCRAQLALAATPPPPVSQQQAISHHLTWMMQFLRAHHRAEDDGLYPLVRRREPAAAALLDAMHADHETIAAAIGEVEGAADAVSAGGDHDRLVVALDDLATVLLPHLRREEDEMMPVVSSVVTEAEWRAVEQEHNLDPKSFVELGREGHWIIDGAHDDDRRAVLSLVPPVPRFVLLHAFAGSYRRRAAACWQGTAPSGRRVQKSGRCEVLVDARADVLWEVVRDVTRVGEWSHECVGARWLDGATEATPGARFRGRNRAGLFRWGRVCEILAAAPYELVWRTVPTALYPDSTRWAIRLHPAGGATRLEQTFAVLRAPRLLDALYARLIPPHQDRTAALTADLRRLGDLVSSPSRPTAQVPVLERTSPGFSSGP
jgi:hypothetical protein